MNEGTNIDRLKDLLDQRSRKQIPKQVVWGTVKDIDWGSKTCTVTGLADNLDYLDVSLGIKNEIIKPKIGSKCMIGSVENEEAETYLINAEEFDERIFISGDTELHITESGFIVKRGESDLKLILKETFDQLKAAKILTPSGPGQFSPDDKLKFEELKNKVLNLFK